MRADFTVILDACVLASANCCDLLLSLAEEPRLFLPRWTEEILAEVRRTQLDKLNWPVHLADYWQEQVRASFPEAMIADYESLLSVCQNHEKDRHVLAAAIKCNAELIVTSNLRHFRKEQMEPWHIEAADPDSYLLTLYTMEPGLLVSKIESIARRRNLEPEICLSRMAASLPAFAYHVAENVGWHFRQG
jgi:predicted nucleic acid-binding protein